MSRCGAGKKHNFCIVLSKSIHVSPAPLGARRPCNPEDTAVDRALWRLRNESVAPEVLKYKRHTFLCVRNAKSWLVHTTRALKKEFEEIIVHTVLQREDVIPELSDRPVPSGSLVGQNKFSESFAPAVSNSIPLPLCCTWSIESRSLRRRSHCVSKCRVATCSGPSSLTKASEEATLVGTEVCEWHPSTVQSAALENKKGTSYLAVGLTFVLDSDSDFESNKLNGFMSWDP